MFDVMTNHHVENTSNTMNWEMLSTPPSQVSTPHQFAENSVWHPALVPGTVAGSLQASGMWSLDHPTSLHDRDWWYRARFQSKGPEMLHLGGLATITDIWVNGVLELVSTSMFVSQEIQLCGPSDVEIYLCFRSLTHALAAQKGRARWRPKMISAQGLRSIRTTLLGHMPGWCPPVHAIGPWQSIKRSTADDVRVVNWRLSATVNGTTGHIRFSVTLENQDMSDLALEIDGQRHAMRHTGQNAYSVAAIVPNVELWWPHTHGNPRLYEVVLYAGDRSIHSKRIGFRSIEVDRGWDAAGFGLRLNGVDVFCRGAVWSSADIVRLTPDRSSYRMWLELARDCGMNMLRVPGTTIYEDDAFYELCDELGLMVWQDFMFANFDYPTQDQAFATQIKAEAQQFLSRTAASPSLSVLCGGSEVFQQAAMLGVAADVWSSAIFTDVLPAVVASSRPDVPYVVNSPSGGALPFSTDVGVAHYFGVGGYLRPLADARLSGVRFASECLAFAAVPEPVTLDGCLPVSPVNHPSWKASVPRDAGAPWDFDDVRDYYIELLYNCDARALRYASAERYLLLSRAAIAEVLTEVIGEWRRTNSVTKGALVLAFQDLVPGAGWGVVDQMGEPKSTWFALRRAYKSIHVVLTDEGLNGLAVHVINDGASPLDLKLSLTSLRDGRQPVMQVSLVVTVPARSTLMRSATDLIGRFFDITYAFKFGPPAHNVTIAQIKDAKSDQLLSEAFHFPLGREITQGRAKINAVLERDAMGWLLCLSTDQFAQSVHIVDEHFRPEDNWFHLSPLAERRIRLVLRPGRASAGEANARKASAAQRDAPCPIGHVSAVNVASNVSYRGVP
jgi:beta-mannosidase